MARACSSQRRTAPARSACRHYDPALIRARVGEINAALAAEQIALELVAGTEICYDSDVVERLKRGELLTYGHSRSILLELSHNTLPPMLENTLFNLQVAGYRVVLAHPERIVEVQQDPNRLLPLIERGVLMQITAAALLGEQGERLQTAAETLLTHGMAHILASDTHGAAAAPAAAAGCRPRSRRRPDRPGGRDRAGDQQSGGGAARPAAPARASRARSRSSTAGCGDMAGSLRPLGIGRGRTQTNADGCSLVNLLFSPYVRFFALLGEKPHIKKEKYHISISESICNRGQLMVL